VTKKRVFTYTHNWRKIKRSSWGRMISILASCETIPQVKQAMRRGYATAIVLLNKTGCGSYRAPTKPEHPQVVLIASSV
jgi:hypothetical protein